MGTGKTVTGNGFGLINNADGNYVLQSATLTTTADITARTVCGAFTASNKVYDGDTSASIAQPLAQAPARRRSRPTAW